MRVRGRGRQVLSRPLIAGWLAAGAVTAALDLLWLGVAASGLYRRELGHLMSDRPYWPAAIVFYCLYAAGVVYFAASPAWKAGEFRLAALNGALLGLLVYGTYDLTNMAVLKNWGGLISTLDVGWGVFLTATAAAAAFAAGKA